MKQFILLILSFSLFASCRIGPAMEGNGNVKTKTFALANFDEVEVTSAMTLELQQGDFGVQLKTDENLFDEFKITVSGNKLKIGRSNGNVDPTFEPIVYVSLPVLQSLRVSGASNAKMDKQFLQNQPLNFNASGASDATIFVRANEVQGKASGASTVTLKGEVLHADIDINGASTLLAYDCVTDKMKVSASGASTAKVYAVTDLDMQSSGASVINFRGKANISRQQASGAGTIVSNDE